MGGILLSASVLPEVMATLKGDEFYRPIHQLIYAAVLSLASASEPVDAVTVGAELEKRGQFRKVGGGPYLLSLIETVPSPANAPFYAKQVARKAKMRRLIETGIRFQQLGFDDSTTDQDVDEAIAQAEKWLGEIQDPPSASLDFKGLVNEWQSWMDTADDIIKTPWPQLNEYLGGGMRTGKVYIIAGRPGDAKSLTGLNILTEAAEQGHKAMMFSLELDRKEVASRILAGGSWSNYGEIFRKKMTRETKDRVFEYIESNDLPLKVNDQHSITVEQICAAIKAEKPEIVLVDYCQLISASNPKADRRLVIEHISRSLKICAAETRCAIVLISQVNRDSTKGSGRMPTMSDLREGGIEGDADVVLITYRPPGDDATIRIGVNKNRDGKNGVLDFVFRGHLARIG